MDDHREATSPSCDTTQNGTSRNGDDNHDLGTGSRRTERAARECTYNDFLKCQPLNFKGTEGVVSLTKWFEKMESVFHISNCTIACQIKFATCTLLGSALMWWNSHVKTNLKVKGTDVLSYNQRFQELALMCLRLFLEESDKVEKFVNGLLGMIQGSMMASKPNTMQDVVEFDTELKDQKIRSLVDREAKNKRKLDETSRNNQNQQQSFKRHMWQGPILLGPRKRKCTGDLNLYALNTTTITIGSVLPSAPTARGMAIWPRTGYFKRDCPKLKNNNWGNQAGNGGATTRAYALGNAGKNPDVNVVTGMFLLNNRYASILFDTGANRSFMSIAFSSLNDIVQTALDYDYDVKLADEKIIGVNTIIRGCT
ncbi:hypothetical protein Tco_1097576 [Tanacetum coccineum]